MRRLILALVLVLAAVPAFAQQTISIALSAKQVEAMQVKFGADVNAQAKVQDQVNSWLSTIVYERDEQARRQFRDAFDKATPTQQAQIRQVLGVSVNPAVTAEEQAAVKAQADAEKAARQAERQKALADKMAALLAACEAQTPKVDCSFIK